MTVTNSGWKYFNDVTIKNKSGYSICYARKSTVKVKIIYPKKYKDLVIGVGGYTAAPVYSEYNSGAGSSSAGVKAVDIDAFWSGKKPF